MRSMIPALFTSTSTPPNRSTAVAVTASTTACSLRSPVTATASPLACSISFTTASAPSAFRSATRTLAPSAAKASAAARPMPEPAPVTMTPRPSSPLAMRCSCPECEGSAPPGGCPPYDLMSSSDIKLWWRIPGGHDGSRRGTDDRTQRTHRTTTAHRDTQGRDPSGDRPGRGGVVRRPGRHGDHRRTDRPGRRRLRAHGVALLPEQGGLRTAALLGRHRRDRRPPAGVAPRPAPVGTLRPHPRDRPPRRHRPRRRDRLRPRPPHPHRTGPARDLAPDLRRGGTGVRPSPGRTGGAAAGRSAAHDPGGDAQRGVAGGGGAVRVGGGGERARR